MVIRRYRVDYGHGIATIWIKESIETQLSEATFDNYAYQCFGLRKSMSGFKILEIETTNEFPGFWNKPEVACVLKHNGDTIVWGYDGEKIKTEFD